MIDTTSLHTLRLDCLLQIHGIPGIESTGFTAYTRYLAQQRKDIDSSKTFWSKTLSDIAPQSIFGLEPDALDGFNQDRHGRFSSELFVEMQTLWAQTLASDVLTKPIPSDSAFPLGKTHPSLTYPTL
ncbi:hypothetical protein LB505_013004 [Fusarium chuoi]|nr:hypothetical protein LB505_013004 [Fusarium chuoi]